MIYKQQSFINHLGEKDSFGTWVEEPTYVEEPEFSKAELHGEGPEWEANERKVAKQIQDWKNLSREEKYCEVLKNFPSYDRSGDVFTAVTVAQNRMNEVKLAKYDDNSWFGYLSTFEEKMREILGPYHIHMTQNVGTVSDWASAERSYKFADIIGNIIELKVRAYSDGKYLEEATEWKKAVDEGKEAQKKYFEEKPYFQFDKKNVPFEDIKVEITSTNTILKKIQEGEL